MTALRFHRWNAIFLGGFIVLHFATHLAGLWGIEAYNSVQSLARLVYRNRVIEPILLLSVGFQGFWGAYLLWQKFRRGLRGKWARRQAVSGAILLFFLTEHLIAMAMARWGNGLNTNFFWPASVMNGAPFYWYFVPYYFAGVVALFVHIACGVRLALLRIGFGARADHFFWAVTVLGGVTAVLIDLMLLGAFYDISLPPEWVSYLGQFIAGYRQ